MAIDVYCDDCSTTFRVRDDLAGKRIKCKRCGAALRVQSDEVDEVEQVDEPVPSRRGKKRSPPRKEKTSGWNVNLFLLVGGGALGVLLIMVIGLAVLLRSIVPAELASAVSQPANPAAQAASLSEARKGFQTRLTQRESAREPVEPSPPDVFTTVQFAAPVGNLAAYLTPDPKDGNKHPAIIWTTGGDCNTIGDVWSDAAAANDQTAAAYRKAGIVMMFPSLRGGNQNPGFREGFLGEVDDVLAAADFLSRQSFVDPARIYLGGHSTGGTLVLLVAECSDRFRAIFSFGPADDVRGYGGNYSPFDTSNAREVELRSPGNWLTSIKSPTFVFEGTVQGNIESLQTMARSSSNPQVHFLPVRGGTHFNILAPTNSLIAAKILGDIGPASTLTFTDAELSKPFGN